VGLASSCTKVSLARHAKSLSIPQQVGIPGQLARWPGWSGIEVPELNSRPVDAVVPPLLRQLQTPNVTRQLTNSGTITYVWRTELLAFDDAGTNQQFTQEPEQYLTMTHWQLAKLSELSALEAFEFLRLRQQVFVLEQQCLYEDIDGIDSDAWHLLGRNREGVLVAYLRIIPPLGKYPGPAIGRVLTSASARSGGLGKQLMNEGIAQACALFPATAIYLSAQTYLLKFYRDLGFESVGAPFDEDGIEHIEMVRTAQ
jgi:ElaA protein